MSISELIEGIGLAVDLAAVALMVGGVALATIRAAARLRRRTATVRVYREYRQWLGRSILLGLELLIAGDIIRTVAITPTFESLGVLAVIVLIRTFLSFTLEVELTGRWPWSGRRRQKDGGEASQG